MVDTAHEKESRARDTINQLKLEIANLTKLAEQSAGLGLGSDGKWVWVGGASIVYLLAPAPAAQQGFMGHCIDVWMGPAYSVQWWRCTHQWAGHKISQTPC